MLSSGVEGLLIEHPFLVQVHLLELDTRIQRVKLNLSNFNKVLERRLGDWSEMNSQEQIQTDLEFWDALHTLINSLAYIGQAFKPSAPKKMVSELNFCQRKKHTKLRGKALREIASISSDHIILGRDLRNRLVHFDEDLDCWYFRLSGKPMVRHVFAPVKNSFDEIPDADVFERFDAETNKYYYQGRAFDIPKMLEGCKQVIENLRENLQYLRKYNINFVVR